MRHLEVGADVGHVDVVTLFEQVEGLFTEVASVTAIVEAYNGLTRDRSSLTTKVTELERIPC